MSMIVVNRKIYKRMQVQVDGECSRCGDKIRSGNVAYRPHRHPTTGKNRYDRICRECGLGFISREDVHI